MAKVKIQNDEYDFGELTDEHKAVLKTIRSIDQSLVDKKALLAALMTAKNAYLSELKKEILKSKSGFDFLE